MQPKGPRRWIEDGHVGGTGQAFEVGDPSPVGLSGVHDETYGSFVDGRGVGADQVQQRGGDVRIAQRHRASQPAQLPGDREQAVSSTVLGERRQPNPASESQAACNASATASVPAAHAPGQ